MAIAPSKLGRIVAQHWHSTDSLVRRLRESNLVREDASDEDLRATFRMAREENSALPPGEREYNSPNERVRVFLAPFLSDKGRTWAVPLKSLQLPDHDGSSRSRPRLNPGRSAEHMNDLVIHSATIDGASLREILHVSCHGVHDWTHGR